MNAIIISCFNWYEHRLDKISIFFEAKGYKVDMYFSDYSHGKKQYERPFEYINNVHYVHVRSYNNNLSLSRIESHLDFSNKIKKILIEKRPDVVYALVPPNSVVKTCASLKKKIGYKLIFDVIDLWPESFPSKINSLPPFKIWKKLRNKYINMADKVVLECDYYKSIIENVVDNNKINVLHLMKPSIPSVANANNIKFKKDNKINNITLAYLGSMNSLIDIESITKIIKQLKTIASVSVEIIGNGSSKDFFFKELENNGAKINYHGVIYDDIQKAEIFKDCDFGINIYKSSVAIGLTLKSIDYFQLGLPILNSIKGDTWKFVETMGIGINVDDNSEIDLQEISNILINRQQITNRVQQVFYKFFNEETVNERLQFLDTVV